MKIVSKQGREEIAVVYIAEDDDGKRIEFVESVEPPILREEKWVNILSTLYGCPVNCPMCDAGNFYRGKLSAEEILWQLDYLVENRWPDGNIPANKWKVQFARMGDPAFNPAVLEVLETLPDRYKCPGLMPCISTIAPRGTNAFFERLIDIKHRLYPLNFQLQFSLHTTDEGFHAKLIPARTWTFREINEYGERFHIEGGRKLTLNFALLKDAPLEPEVLLKYFDPDRFLVKITPVNPTFSLLKSGYKSLFEEDYDAFRETVERVRNAGYDAIESIGELEENAIGSNCGQYVTAMSEIMNY